MASFNRRSFLAGSTLVGSAMALAARESAAKTGGDQKIKIGQIGVGHAHANKLAVYRRWPDYEVVGIVEPDERLRARAVGDPAFAGLPWMSEEQLLDVPGLQAVLIETRVRDLLTTAEHCVAAGKHVHLDKPAGESLPHYRRIVEAAKRQSLLVQMGYMLRYNPAVVLLRDLLARGWLGEPFEVVAVMSKVVGANERPRLAEYSGGMMFELGCHVIDLVVGVLGKPDRVMPFPRRSGKFNDGLVDNMLAVLEYPQATATVRASALEVDGFARRQLTVCGSEGTFHIQPLEPPAVRLALASPRGEYRSGYQNVAVGKYERYLDDAADMAAIIRGEKQADFSYDHDLAVQETVLRASDLPVE